MTCKKPTPCSCKKEEATAFSRGVSKTGLQTELMAIDFAITDIKLYLDTHPGDGEAIRLYNNLVAKRLAMFDSYQSMFGPLVAEAYTGSDGEWDWTDNPWPWQPAECRTPEPRVAPACPAAPGPAMTERCPAMAEPAATCPGTAGRKEG